MSSHQGYWDAFYAGRSSKNVPAEPSAFAHWTRERLAPGQPIFEFGFGNARDSLWWARNGHPVIGYDFAPSAVLQAQGHADAEGMPAEFAELDLYDRAATSLVGKSIGAADRSSVIYGRFLIHSLETEGRHALLDLAATGLVGGGQLYLEFRTGHDADTRHEFGEDHYRTYLDPTIVEAEIAHRGGTITHLESGHGLAVYKAEDPHVARLVASWS